mmetsp:Transcript_30559/g.49042  ORF Transcript_30559/g.49042 Transcript_30559/m.49042 type:complete len:142 (+) Transcript_30559:108-533(+)
MATRHACAMGTLEHIGCGHSSKKESFPAGIHFPPLVYPFVLPRLCIKRPLHEPSQLQRERRAKLLQVGFFRPVKYVSMVPEEYKIPLIVKCRNSAPLEVWPGSKQRTQHPRNTLAKPSAKVVKNDLWFDVDGAATVGNVFR